MSRDREAGIVLINVLVILALAAGIVALMFGSRDTARDRIGGMADAARAEALALGAEASVVAALRRDLDTAPEADHFSEPWARIAQEEVTLATGRFSVTIRDVQRKYDINRLATGGLGPVSTLARLLEDLDQPPELATRIAAVLVRTGPVPALENLTAFGIPAPALRAIAPYVTALPVEGTVNLNTAEPPLLRAMFANRAIAARLLAQRARDGQITRDALSGAGAVRPDHSGFTSNLFEVEILAEAGSAAVRLHSLILRRDALSGQSVGIVSRRFSDVHAIDTPE